MLKKIIILVSVLICMSGVYASITAGTISTTSLTSGTGVFTSHVLSSSLGVTNNLQVNGTITDGNDVQYVKADGSVAMDSLNVSNFYLSGDNVERNTTFFVPDSNNYTRTYIFETNGRTTFSTDEQDGTSEPRIHLYNGINQTYVQFTKPVSGGLIVDFSTGILYNAYFHWSHADYQDFLHNDSLYGVDFQTRNSDGSMSVKLAILGQDSTLCDEGEVCIQDTDLDLDGNNIKGVLGTYSDRIYSDGIEATSDSINPYLLLAGGTPYIDFSNSSAGGSDMRFLLNNDDQMTLSGGKFVFDTQTVTTTSGIYQVSATSGSESGWNNRYGAVFQNAGNGGSLLATRGVGSASRPLAFFYDYGATSQPVVDILGVGTGSPLRLQANTSVIPCDSTNEGGFYYNTNTNKHYGCDGSTWNALY